MEDTCKPQIPSEKVFLSYSRTDRDAAIALRAELEKTGISVFRDEDAIRVGDHWLQHLQEALKSCSAFVLLVGQDGVQRWVGAEVQVALVRNLSPHDDKQRLPIFPLALPDGELNKLPPFLQLFQVLNWQVDKALPEALIAAIRDKLELLDDSARSWNPQESPFLGLSAFQPEHAHLFFGRRRETLEALKYLGSQEQAHPENINVSGASFCRWLQIEGNSGSGKSSLVNAGMLPMIEQGTLWSRTGYSRWQIIGPMMPGETPLDRLALELDQALSDASGKRDHLQRLQALEKDDPRVLASMIKDAMQEDRNEAFLLVVDQFEELFTFSEKTEKQRFDKQLANALQDKDCPLFLISTVRIDFLEGFEQLPDLSELYNDTCKRYLLKIISSDGLREVIEQPARLAGLDVSEITTAMLGDAKNEVGALPLVENALHYLWKNREHNKLSGDLYDDKGGIAGLLEDQADRLLERLDKDKGVAKGQAGALELLLALTRINPEGRHTRQRIALEEARRIAGLGDLERGQKVIDYLSGMRQVDGSKLNGSLRLVISAGETAEKNSDQQQEIRTSTPERPWYKEKYVDLIHETLIRARGKNEETGKMEGYWKTLYAYIEKNRGRPFYRDQLRLQAQSWQKNQGFKRWWKLAGWRDLSFYRKMYPPKHSIENRFLFRSRWKARAQLGLLVLIVAFIGESYWWTLDHGLPPGYMWMQQRFRLMNAELLEAPLPEMVFINADEEVSIGETDKVFIMRVPEKLKENFGIPTTKVDISQSYFLSRYEITYEQYDYYVWDQQLTGDIKESVKYPDNAPGGRDQHPVVNVSLKDTYRYLQWLTNKTKDDYRLPTEAEWEYAARAGTQTAYWWGDAIGKDNANCDGCGSQWDNEESAPVGKFKPNAFDLYDIAGNVWEWTCSAWKESYDGSEMVCADPDDPVSRVLRGGSWDITADNLRSSGRLNFTPDYRFFDVGFRAARTN